MDDNCKAKKQRVCICMDRTSISTQSDRKLLRELCRREDLRD
jgi:hypothetical protein